VLPYEKGELLKALERHKMLTLALERKITQKEAAREFGLSLSHTKRLFRRFKEAAGNISWLFYHRTHPAPNRLPEEIRDKAIALKRKNRGRSNPFIAEILYEESRVKIHPNTVRNILLEKREYCRSPSRRFEMEAFGQMVQMEPFFHLQRRNLGRGGYCRNPSSSCGAWDYSYYPFSRCSPTA
jgi:transposase